MSERDKWGRIPATLIEQDQPFCSLRWGEIPCGAGPQSNYMVYSAALGEPPLWDTNGIVSSAGPPFGESGLGGNNSVGLDGANSGFLTVALSERPRLPVFTTTRRLYFSFVFDVTDLSPVRVSSTLFRADTGADRVAGFDFDPDTEAAMAVDPEINDITVSNTPDPQWREVEFWVDSAEYFTDGVAYSAFLSFSVSGGSERFRVGNPQISLDVSTEYRQTAADPVEADSVPCFNTVSSCQALQTFTVEGMTDALSLGNQVSEGLQSFSYTSGFAGTRDEGIYLEFYLGVAEDPQESDTFDVKAIDIDGIMSVNITGGFGQPLGVTFNVAGASVFMLLDGGDETVYRLAAYVSRGGTLKIRGFKNAFQADPFSAVPEDITISVDSSLNPFSIADLLVYDYEVKPVQFDTPRRDLIQKGDIAGDPLFYARFIRPTKAVSGRGIVPAPLSVANFKNAAQTDPRVADLFKDGPDGVVDLYGVGPVKLLEPPLILRYTVRNKSSRLPETLRAIPSLAREPTNKPAQLSVGGTNENIGALGARDELNIEWRDHPYSDLLVDPYIDQRPYIPEEQGTFWGKWLARNVYKEGQAIRYVSGYELPGGGFERTNVYNYVLEKINGPSSSGRVTGRAFDLLQQLQADKAVYPQPSTGRLAFAIGTGASSMTLDPVGIGAEEYPAAFRCRVGGEGFDVTRSGDTLNITQRGLYGGLESHAQDDTVQIVARFESVRIHDAAETIITGALPSLASNIPKEKWDGLAEDFLPRLYSADITEPTGVEDLLAELTTTAPIYFYADVRTNLIELGVIREPAQVSTVLTEGAELIAGSVDLKEYPKERVDEVWVYYRIRNAAENVDDLENYSQRFILVNPQEQDLRGQRSIKRIFTRWIEAGARDTAEEIAQAYISRFQSQPIRASFDLDARHGDIWLGDVATIISRQKQTVTGEPRSDLSYQVIQAHEPEPGQAFQYIAQSYEFVSPVDVDSITITIQPEDTVDGTGAVDQIDLRELYNSVVAAEIPTITFVVAGGPLPAGGAVVGGGAGQNWSLNLPNDWPWGPSISLRVESGGVVAGRGGGGGLAGLVSSINGSPGADGQLGVLVQYPVEVTNLGIIGGGGGGGGGGGAFSASDGAANGGGGGGGAGRESGVGGQSGGNNPPVGQDGTSTQGGAGGDAVFVNQSRFAGDGGRGGGLGEAGESGQNASAGGSGAIGGQPGAAVDGVSFVTYITRGDIRGSEIN